VSDRCWSEACNGCAERDGPSADGGYWPEDIGGSLWSYWSSSYDWDWSRLAWFVNFSTGYVHQFTKTTPLYVRCVRPGP
jgi:hypothetical protein